MSPTDEAPEVGEVEEAFADKKELFLRKFPVRRVSFKALAFLSFELLKAFLRGRWVFRHSSAQLPNRFSNYLSNSKVKLVRVVFSDDVISP